VHGIATIAPQSEMGRQSIGDTSAGHEKGG
jgi:hypothetical protein